MKSFKYVLMGALLFGAAAPVMAQDDNKAIIDQAVSVIKSKPANLKDQVKDFAKKYKKNAEVLTALGKACLEEKDTANARVFADQALARDSKYAQAWLLKGDIAVSQNNGGAAATAYQNAMYFDPKEPEGYYKYAMVQRGVDPAGAAQVLEDLRQQRPDYPVDQLIGHIFYNAQNYEKAAEAFAKVADVTKMKPEYITEFATATWLLGQREKSIEVCKAGLTVNPRKAAWNRIAFYDYTDLKKTDEALAYADKLFNASDSAHFIAEDYTYYGTAMQQAKRWDDAVQAYEKALKLNEGNNKQMGIINKNLSDVYLQKGDYDNAVAFLEKSMAGSDKPTMDQLDNLGSLYTEIASKKLKANDKAGSDEAFKNADQVYGRMLEAYPNYANYCNYMRGQINANLDPDSKAGLAKPYYEALVKSLEAKAEKQNSEIAMLKQAYLYLIVYDFNVLQDKVAAKAVAEKLLVIDPENSVAKQVKDM
ncbi:MAG TPA: hypothetical protein DD401_03015 [Prevotella sp.]|nr:hypothetical protein [Prevotella sp.]